MAVRWGWPGRDQRPPVALQHSCGHRLEVGRVCRHCGGPVTRESIQTVRP